jgi:vacuolar-type H+-ATPase subunit H
MVDQDFIGQIRAAEKQEDELISTARDNAAIAIEEARNKAAEMLSSARAQADEEQRELLDSATRQAAAIEQEAVESDNTTDDDTDLHEAVSAVAGRIVNYCVDR